MSESEGRCMDSTFSPVNLGQFGFTYKYFTKLMQTFELPTYGDATDPFNPIKKFDDKWNECGSRSDVLL